VQRVREAVARMNADGTLPPGVHIDAFYDRGDLVAITVRTVLNNMLFGVVLIFFIQWMFLGDLRSALIVSATIPVALFLAVIITVLRGESANLLSIGAIDLGIIVDATVIMVETFFNVVCFNLWGGKLRSSGRCWNEFANARDYLCLACRHGGTWLAVRVRGVCAGAQAADRAVAVGARGRYAGSRGSRAAPAKVAKAIFR
jgi:AcrB/AcrD/AcrF family